MRTAFSGSVWKNSSVSTPVPSSSNTRALTHGTLNESLTWETKCTLLIKKTIQIHLSLQNFYQCEFKSYLSLADGEVVAESQVRLIHDRILPHYIFCFKKEQLAQKWKFSHYLLTPILIKRWVKLCSPQNISGTSQQKKRSHHSPKQLK